MRDPMHSIVRQAGAKSVESRIAIQHAMTADVPLVTVPIEQLELHAAAIRSGALPVGSVEFVRRAMEVAGITEPRNFSYPPALTGYLHRSVERRAAGKVWGRWFIKPVTTKAFTGFVVDTRENPDGMDCHDRIQFNEFLALPPDDLVWVAEPVEWLSECRFYIAQGEILGYGRYDDGPDDAPLPAESIVQEMALQLAAAQELPAGFAIDVGVMRCGKTALVECNDAWALGYYKGSCSPSAYMRMLWERWRQLFLA